MVTMFIGRCMGNRTNTELSDRLVELATYITHKHEDNPRFGALKLAKILFYTDRAYYRNHGETFTGLNYFAFEHGPFTRDIYGLATSGAIRFKKGLLGIGQGRPVATREPDMGTLTAEVIEEADGQIARMWDMGYREVSHMSHGVAWDVARAERGDRAPIDGELMLVHDPEEAPGWMMDELREATLE